MYSFRLTGEDIVDILSLGDSFKVASLFILRDFALPNFPTVAASNYLFEQLDEEVVAVTRMSSVEDEMEFDEE